MSRRTVHMRLLPAAALVAAAAMSTTVTTSCKDDSSLDTADVDTSVVIPTMLTRDVETLISDSGVTRYRIVTPIWYVYDEVEEPYWRFPEGLNLDKYDNFFRTEATVRADSAIYLKRKQTWQLDGNVSISNVMNEKFLTQQLFWDQRTHKLYSDSFIHIERTDRVLEGYGFESNEQLTRYTIKKVSGIFPASEFKSKGRQTEEQPTDSVETEN
ncbi:LPS export ABC transporter periplasmic protein LptC [Duncaniella muricolitica]|uniref:LPS export ABC transporter periplasmic protein LptC n=1 Tax=Duncaniella muricolitica TaxID=2880704 RepID=UPI00244DDEA3|nr:LPS export ABC transporter periplasmic protein LptC [Duncaniella muricolitica]